MVFKSKISGIEYKNINKIGEGGQGYIFKVKDDSNNIYALKLYKTSQNNKLQKEIIENLIKYDIKSNNNDVEYVWPIDIIEYKNMFGYIMLFYDNTKYIHYNKVINQRVKPPSLKTLAYLSYLIVEALHVIHRNGLAYCDINLGNIQFNFEDEKIIICDNDNVVVNNSDVNVMGVPEFMAPEVALKQNGPNADSDLYSLAILLYMLWFYEHPMEGKKVNEIRCWDLVAKKEFYHKNPIFVHNPNDKSNSIKEVPIYQLSYARWKVYAPNRMRKEFIKTFTEGIKKPTVRTKTSIWKKIFIEIMSNIIKCPYCGEENIYDPDNTLTYCAKCKNFYPNYYYFDIREGNSQKYRIVVRENQYIYPYHFGNLKNTSEQSPLAKIEKHPNKKGAFIIRNLSNNKFEYLVSNNRYDIEPGRARAIISDGKINIENIQLLIKRKNAR